MEDAIRAAVTPSSADVQRARVALAGLLSDGFAHRNGTLLTVLARAQGVDPPEGQRSGLVLGETSEPLSLIRRDHRAVAYPRLLWAAAEALGDFVAGGAVVSAASDRPSPQCSPSGL